MKILTCYFSTAGVTEKAAEIIASKTGCGLFEIRPLTPYTKADLNYLNPLSRSNREKIKKQDVEVKDYPKDIGSCDLIAIGFPIWYGEAPNIIKTFLKNAGITTQKIAVFATSGGSGIGKTATRLAPYLPQAEIVCAELLSDERECEAFAQTLMNI